MESQIGKFSDEQPDAVAGGKQRHRYHDNRTKRVIMIMSKEEAELT